ncbi:MAG: hypothetical protein AAF253_12265, partial [Pseudomonadota bacterium]
MTTPPGDPRAGPQTAIRMDGLRQPRPPVVTERSEGPPARPPVPTAAKAATPPNGPKPKLRSDNLRVPDPDAGRLPLSARNVLSAEEIQALLNPDLDDLPAEPSPSTRRDHPLASFDTPTADEATALTLACDRLVARLSHQFQAPNQLGAVLRLSTAEMRPFRASLESQADGGLMACLSDTEGTVGAALALTPEAASALIERAGGASETLALSSRPRPLTALDDQLLQQGLAPLIALFPSLTTVRIYKDRARAGATVPPGDAVRLALTLQLGPRAWPATLLLDAGLIARSGAAADAEQAQRQTEAPVLPPAMADAGAL